jgi:hypothetical protein
MPELRNQGSLLPAYKKINGLLASASFALVQWVFLSNRTKEQGDTQATRPCDSHWCCVAVEN